METKKELKTRVGKRQGNTQWSPIVYTCPKCKSKVIATDYGESGCGRCFETVIVIPPKRG